MSETEDCKSCNNSKKMREYKERTEKLLIKYKNLIVKQNKMYMLMQQQYLQLQVKFQMMQNQKVNFQMMQNQKVNKCKNKECNLNTNPGFFWCKNCTDIHKSKLKSNDNVV
jgi:hypothetical protein